MREDNNPPAIVRDYKDIDREASIITEIYNSVTFTRGLGDSGYKIQTVEHECPNCGFDRMIRRVGVNPEMRDEVRYHCLNPNCGHHVGDMYQYACSSQTRTSPTTFDGVDAQ